MKVYIVLDNEENGNDAVKYVARSMKEVNAWFDDLDIDKKTHKQWYTTERWTV